MTLVRRLVLLTIFVAPFTGCAADEIEDAADDDRDDEESDATEDDQEDGGKRDAASARDSGPDARARDGGDARVRDSGDGVGDSGRATPKDAGRVDTGGSDEGSDAGAPMMSGPDPEPGRLAGITAAHNAVRAGVDTSPALPPLTWSEEIAQVAQTYADKLAAGCSNTLTHSGDRRYGENLAMVGGVGVGGSAKGAVDGWTGEVSCWTYGTVAGSEGCDATCIAAQHSNGCGHYTQLVWRKTTQVGCGVADCSDGRLTKSYWVCNYSPQGNFVGQTPY